MPPGLAALAQEPDFKFAEPWLVRSIAPTVDEAFSLLGPDAPENLLPIAALDDESFACVVCAPAQLPDDAGNGLVVRWHTRDIAPRFQADVIDIGIVDYVSSVDEELAARRDGLRRMLDQIGPAYEESYLDKEKRPRDFVIRPVRIACQNVIVGLAAFAQDSTFDGLSVVAWQTCEVPHVATHEGNRALAALTLCDAFRNGGTMEIRFDRDARVSCQGRRVVYHGHVEKAVPASLRRYGRTVGVDLGAKDPAAITPAEARELFLAVTPMPAELRARVDDVRATRGISPERICFSLLSQIWREPELDFLLAASARAASILEGGAPWTDRASRQAESEVCRAAVMAGMLFRRLNSTDAAGDASSAVRVVEDRSKGVTWHVDEVKAAITFRGVDATAPVPWARGTGGVDEVTVFPRTALTSDLAQAVAADDSAAFKAVLVPADVPSPPDLDGVVVLRCPDRLADIDKDIERRLLTSRISRG
jgi:hypothetical protein